MLRSIHSQSTFRQTKPQAGQSEPTGLREAPAHLNSGDPHAVGALNQRLAAAPALQVWCEQTFDGADHPGVCAAVASLMLHTPAAARQQRTDAIPGDRPSALSTLAAHRSGTSKDALQQTWDANAAPHRFSDYLRDSGRLCWLGQVGCRKGDEQVGEWDWAPAAQACTTAARAYAQLPGQEAKQEELDLIGAKACTLAQQLETAAAIYLRVGTSAFERHGTLKDDKARETHLTTAATAFAAASAAYTELQQRKQALDADLLAARVLAWQRKYSQAAVLFTKVGAAWSGRSDAYEQAGQPQRATAATRHAESAFKWGGEAHQKAKAYGRAGAAFYKAKEYIKGDWVRATQFWAEPRTGDYVNVMALVGECQQKATADESWT